MVFFYLAFQGFYVVQSGPQLAIRLGMTLNLLCHRCVPPCPAYGVLGIEPMALCMLAKRATRQLGCITSFSSASKAKGLWFSLPLVEALGGRQPALN